jgi:hypothetical protein
MGAVTSDALEAYPLSGYGAVEIGAHIFCDSRKKPKCDREKDGIANFVMLWQQLCRCNRVGEGLCHWRASF